MGAGVPVGQVPVCSCSGGRRVGRLGQDGEGSVGGVGPRLVLEGPCVGGGSYAHFRDVGGLLHGRGEEPKAELVGA